MADTDLLPEDSKPGITPDFPGAREIDEDDPAFTAAKDQMHAEAESALKDGGSGSSGGNKEKDSKGEDSSANDTVGSGYHEADKGRAANARSFVVRNRRNIALGGGVGGGIVAVFIVLFLALIPLKIEDMLTNLRSHYFGTSQDAVTNETDQLFDGYVERDIGAALTDKSCGTTISKHCKVNIFGDARNPVYNLYKNWAQNKLETKLAEDYGIEIIYDSAAKKYYMKAPGITAKNGEAISTAGEGHIDNNMFREVDQGTIRETVDAALDNETGFTKVMLHVKFADFLREKYEVKWCEFACKVTDPVQNFVRKGVNSAQVMIAQRVVTPYSQSLGIVLQCLFDSSCDPGSTSPVAGADGTTSELNGEAESSVIGSERTTLTQLAQSYGINDTEAIDKMISDYKAIAEGGYQKFILSKALSAFGIDELSDQLSDAAPFIGWVKSVSGFIADAAKLGPKIKTLDYEANSRAAVASFALFQSFVSEMHTGHTDPSVVGDMENALGPGDNGSSSDPEVGGTADATQTPLYQELNPGDNTPTGPSSSNGATSSFLGSLVPSAYADEKNSTTTPKYTCHSGQGVPAGKLVCPEEVLGQGNAVASNVSSFLHEPGVSEVTSAATAIHGVTFLPGEAIGTAITSVPGVSSLFSGVSGMLDGMVKPVTTDVVKDVVPDPFGTNMSGGRTYDMVAAGGDVSGNDYCHNGLGCKQLTPAQVGAIDNQQESAARQQFDNEPLFARIFSTSSPYSLISRVAMDMPLNRLGTIQSIASIIRDPFTLFHNFSSILTAKVSAAATPQADPFGVTQYGYTSADIAAIGDPQTYWQNHCLDGADGAETQAWDQAAASGPVDPNNGTPVNTTTDPCLLIEAAVGSAGAEFDSSLLTPDEQSFVSGDDSSSTDNTTSTPATTTTTTTNNNGPTLSIDNNAAELVAKQSSATVGYALYSSSGRLVASYNSDNENYGASITKAMVLVAYLDQIGSAKPSPFVTGMIEQSNDADSNKVIQLLKNPTSEINAVATKAGMSGFKFNIEGDSLYWLGQSQVTANDFAKFFSKIDTMFPASQKTYALNQLSNISNKAGLLLSNLPGTVYSKEGWKPEPGGGGDPARSGNPNPFGAEGAPYVVNQAAQFSSNGTTYGVAVTVSGTQNQQAGESIIDNVVSALIQVPQ